MAQDLTDAQWAFIEPLLPALPQRADGRGRPWLRIWNGAGRFTYKECLIDGSFGAAKKGARESGKPSGARGVRSWQLQTALVCLSPYSQAPLRRMILAKK